MRLLFVKQTKYQLVAKFATTTGCNKDYKQKTRLHHQHKNWERNHRDYSAKIQKNMENKIIIEKIISTERFQPYLAYHKNDQKKAIQHYKSNILISEAFYPLLSILEIGLRNSIDFQLTKRFDDENWFENREFIKIASRFQIDRISDARSNILSEKKEITSGRIISELSFGFWTSLFDTKFEMSLWKTLRLAFPNCPKEIRKRRAMSSKFNSVRKLRNRIFHHEAITWNLDVIQQYEKEILEALNWLNKDLLIWLGRLNHIEKVIEENRSKIVE